MSIIKIPEVLREKLSSKGADALLEVLNHVEQFSRENTLVLVEEKFERRLSEEIAKVYRCITEESAKLDKSISQSETKILRWLVLLWTSQMAVHFLK